MKAFGFTRLVPPSGCIKETHFLSLYVIIIECNMQYDPKGCSQCNMFTGVIDDGLLFKKKFTHSSYHSVHVISVVFNVKHAEVFEHSENFEPDLQ